MAFPLLRLGAFALSFTAATLFAQSASTPITPPSAGQTAPVEPPPTSQFSSSSTQHQEQLPDMQTEQASTHAAFDRKYHYGLLTKVGTAGAGIELGIPVSRHMAVRVGGDFMRYNGSFQEDQTTVNAKLQFGYARISADYFPWANRRFHISPLLVLANQTHLQANVSVDPNQELDLEGGKFRSSPTDPLHGVGRVDFRKFAPGATIGFGNITHGKGHFTFPVEMGFFYNGQPKLNIDFSGTACVVGQPAEYGCMKVQDQADFQADLQKFRARQEHNLSYAKYIPVFNVGMGYRF